MKRLISLFLAAVMLAAALASCAASPQARASFAANIRLTSSDAADAAEWLTDRLGDKLTDKLVIGTDADGYGVDVSALEADGYVIRALGDEVALFARTPDGLDRAVRKYAKTVEAGSSAEDVTYHEGYRVKRIEIAGRDISEYTIYCEDDEPMKSAAEELASRIAQANGAALSVSTVEPSAPYIALKYVHDDALGNVGHRWSVTEEGVVIECSDGYQSTSASYAVRRFLEKNLGWMGLIFGIEDLPAADLVSIDVGTAFEEKVAFEWARPCSSTTIKYDKQLNADGFYGERMYCCHGMQNNRFASDLSASPNHNWAVDQPCWLDDTFYETAREDIVAYIESRVKAGAKVGEDFTFIDVSHGDNSNWCKCTKCRRMYTAEGTHAAEVLTWINALSDDLNETYPGLIYGVFAYEMTKKPPKTIKPNEHVTVSFCYDRKCSSHPLDGTKCTSLDQWEVRGHSNPELTSMLESWLEICDYVTVWDYCMSNGLLSMSFLHTARDDLRFLYDIGVKQVFGCSDDNGFSGNWIAFSLMSELYWDINMSDKEYDALYERMLRAFYGDAAVDMRQYFDMLARVEQYGACRTCWGAYMESPEYSLAVDADSYSPKYDALFETIEGAIALANSTIEEERMTMISCTVIYTGSLCAYPKAQAAHDTARMDELSRRYSMIDARLRRFGMEDVMDISPTLEEIFPE